MLSSETLFINVPASNVCLLNSNKRDKEREKKDAAKMDLQRSVNPLKPTLTLILTDQGWVRRRESKKKTWKRNITIPLLLAPYASRES